MAVGQNLGAEERVAKALEAGVERVRVHFTDLLGVSRNKVVPVKLLDECAEDGINFCISAFCVDHAGEVIEGTGLGAEVDFRDAQVVPALLLTGTVRQAADSMLKCLCAGVQLGVERRQRGWIDRRHKRHRPAQSVRKPEG